MTSPSNLLGASRRELRHLLETGHPIAPAELDDSVYRGISLGLPAWVEALSWKTFVKTFHRDPETSRLRGWNVRLEQDGLDAPCRPMRRGTGEIKAFGHFEVVPWTGQRAPVGHGPGLLIDYGRGQNAGLDPIGRLRDPIVALRSGDCTLLLGWSYLALGWSLPTPSFFSLERVGPLDKSWMPGSKSALRPPSSCAEEGRYAAQP